MSVLNASFWDQIYRDAGAYGELPNEFLVNSINDFISRKDTSLPKKVLLIGDGEGRNSIYLGSVVGFEVYSMDQSAVGMSKLDSTALAMGISGKIHTTVADLKDYDFSANKYDIIVSIFVHMPEELRKKVHRNIENSLNDHGLFIMQAYTPKNIGRGVGGPQTPLVCYSLTDICTDFTLLQYPICREEERVVNEGRLHVCKEDQTAAVLEIVGIKKPLKLQYRRSLESDYLRVMGVMVAWWDGQDLRSILSRLFFEHFNETSIIIENEENKEEIIGFLIGFVSQTNPHQGYIHFMGVDPRYRRRAVARNMYLYFEEMVKKRGCTEIHCLTDINNSKSRGFHGSLGYREEPSEDEPHLVLFCKNI